MDPFTTNRIVKKLEQATLKRAKIEGHQAVVRSLLAKYLNEEITKSTTSSLAFGFGVLVRGGYMSESDVVTIMRHLGVLIE